RLLRLFGYAPMQLRAEPFAHQAGDILVLLDSSWHASRFPTLAKLQRDGVQLVAVVYDLIPLQRPEFTEERLRAVFTGWFDWMAAHAAGFLADSRSVAEQVRARLSEQLGEEKAASRWYGYFHLGCELDLASADAEPAAELLEVFAQESVYLAVSTIEP